MLFNAEQRSPENLRMQREDKYNQPLSFWLPKIKPRILADKPLGANALQQFNANYDFLNANFGDVYTKMITLETVNDFLALATAAKVTMFTIESLGSCAKCSSTLLTSQRWKRT